MAVYTIEDKELFNNWLKDIRSAKLAYHLGIKKFNLVEKFSERFGRSITYAGLQSIFDRIEHPEQVKARAARYAENSKINKQNGVSSLKRSSNSQNIGVLLAQYPLILVIGNKVAGYETEEQIKEAITNSQVISDSIKMFEVKERKIKSQIIISIE